jgi:DNA-binding CsgD family transcriptional regulator
MGFTSLTPADEAVRRRAEYLAGLHDLRLVQAMLRLTDALITGTDPAGLALASGWFAEAGSPSWSTTTAMYAARYYSSVGQLDVAERLLDGASGSDTPNDFRQSGLLGARAHIAYCRGQLVDLAESTRRSLGVLPPLTGAHLSVYMNLGYEVVARIAFLAGDRESLEWAATALARAGGGRVPRRIAAIASAHLSLFDGPRADPSIREAIDSTLRQRVQGSAIGGGFMQRETPYLSVAAADVEWIASERAAIEQFVDGGNDVRVLCFMHMLDAVLALHNGDDERATGHWHDLLAVSSEHDFGLLWIDALEGIAISAARAGANDEAAHLSGAAEKAREERCYRYRYPHLAELPSGSDAGRALSLEEATSYARRARGERARPASGWAALTPTEVEVAKAVAAGLTNQQAADRLFMSVPTVKTHLRHIFDKLAINNRAQLVVVVVDHNR